mgnify:CR=1 FL=1
MGNRVAKPDQVVKTVYDSISKSVIESMQTAQSQVFSTQSININCDDTAISAMSNDVNRCIQAFSKKGVDKATIIKLCQPAIRCIANNVSMKSSLNVTDITNQTANIASNIEGSTSNNIKQDLNSMDSSLLLGSKTDTTTINNITKKVSEHTAKITQAVQDSVVQQQGLELDNYEANNVTIDSVTQVIINNLQNIDGLQEIVTKLSNSIVQELSNNTDSLTTWVTRIFIIAMGVILLLFFILFVVKRRDTREFISMVTPYAIFAIGTTIIVLLHLYIKPDYILVDTHTKFKEVSTGKFIFWVSFYAILLGASEIIYYRIIKKRNINK